MLAAIQKDRELYLEIPGAADSITRLRVGASLD